MHIIGLLEAEKDGLLQQIELDISQANELSLESKGRYNNSESVIIYSDYTVCIPANVELLNYFQILLRKLVDLESVLNMTVHQLSPTITGILSQAVNITLQDSVDLAHNSSADVLAIAMEKMKSVKDTSQKTTKAFSEVSQVTAEVERLMDILDALNRTRKEGEAVTTAVTRTVIVSPNEVQTLDH